MDVTVVLDLQPTTIKLKKKYYFIVYNHYSIFLYFIVKIFNIHHY